MVSRARTARTAVHALLAIPVLAAGLLAAAPGARAQVAPPHPGVPLPQSYLDRRAADRTAFEFRHAWIDQARRVQRNRRLRELGILPGIMDASATGGFRVEGVHRIPVLAGKFANTGADPYAPSALQAQLFDGPNPTGTVTQFYDEISYGYITLTGDVIGNGSDGLIQVSQNDTYYEGPSTPTKCNGLCGSAKTGEYLKELLDAADPNVDFGQYDNDGPDGVPNSGDDDGYVDFVAFVQPEKGGECGGTNNIWSHRWVYDGWWGAPYTTNDPSANGGSIKVSDYTIQPLVSCNGSSLIEIGVYAHESGHAFGLPDLYDTDGSSEGIGNWGLMSAGSYGGDGVHPATPSHMCAWSKEQLGWVDPVVLCGGGSGLTLPAVEDTNVVYRIYPHGLIDTEYFLLENRVRTGFDTYLPTSGIAIWHIDNDQPGNQDETHKQVDLEEADGLAQLDQGTNRGDAGDLYPGSSGNPLFADNTNPDARDYLGAATGLSVGGFGATASPRSFDLVVPTCRIAVTDVAVQDSAWGNNNRALDGDETADLRVGLRGDLAGTVTGVRAALTSLTAGVAVLADSVDYGTVEQSSATYGPANFTVQSTGPLADGQAVRFLYQLTGDGGYASTDTLVVHAGAFVLLVEDDGNADNSAYFIGAVGAAGHAVVHYDASIYGPPGVGALRSATAVVWYTGEEYDNTFTPAEQQVVEGFLAGGGALFVTGQDIGYDLVESGDLADRNFYQDVLHAAYLADDSGLSTLIGVAGDPVGNGLSLSLAGGDGAGNSTYPSVIAAGAGASNVFKYNSTKVAGVRYGTGEKLVYCAFNFESISTAAGRDTVMARALNWLRPADITPPTASLVSPAGGDTLSACGSSAITWTASDDVGVAGVDLYLSEDGGAGYPYVIATGLPNTGSYSWNHPGLLGTELRVKLVARDAAGLQAVDAGDSSFVSVSVDPPAAALATPDGGEAFHFGDAIPIRWSMADTCVGIDSTRVYTSVNGGTAWSYLATVPAPDTLATWTAPSVETDSARVRVVVFNHGGLTAESGSDSLFSISSSATAVPETGAGITRPVLLQSRPNPMRAGSAVFAFYLPRAMTATLRIYDLSGRLVATLAHGERGAGYHEAAWDGTNAAGSAVSHGIYFYVLETPDRREVRKLVKLE